MIKYLIAQYILMALIFSIAVAPARSLTLRRGLRRIWKDTFSSQAVPWGGNKPLRRCLG
jgi:hypothetical protein